MLNLAPERNTHVLNVGVVGLGRIGRQHALNALRSRAPTNLICVFTPAPEDIEWAKEWLIPHGVTIHESLPDMLDHPGLEGVIIASSTKAHAEQVKMCIDKGKHVLCEKPLAMSSTEIRSILPYAQQHPDIVVMTAYTRRFDESYRTALAKIRAGEIGAPQVVRSQTCDKYDRSPFYLRYASTSPGVFIDTSIHDVDLTLSFFGADAKPRVLWATGIGAQHPELAKVHDYDHAIGVVEWYPDAAKGLPKRVSYFFASRAMKHGFDNSTEIIGTEGMLKINLTPRKDLLEVADKGGIRHELVDDFYGRYEHAFVTELEVWAECVLHGRELPYTLDTALKGMQIVEALQESLRTGEKIEFDELGRRLQEPKSRL